MKKLISCILILIMLWTPVTALAESSGWDMSAATEITEEVRTLFDKAAAGLMGVSYVPVAVLGVQDGTYCILCKATVVYPGAEPKNVLMYVNDDGVQNIYELWIDRHSAKENPPEAAADTPEDTAVPEDAAAEPEAGADIQYVMYLGTNDMDTNRPVFTQAEAREKAQEILVRHFGGYTMQEANGGWIDNGVLYQEYTLVIYLSDTTEAAVHAAADELIETFRQSSILIQSNPTRTEFYGAS
ncbi:MAG: DUF3574 domain-containing protein [Oscillospiraceae bacterium]|nr:DUF3574 domain-containing protein [Oscillospiraceae bacterium]